MPFEDDFRTALTKGVFKCYLIRTVLFRRRNLCFRACTNRERPSLVPKRAKHAVEATRRGRRRARNNAKGCEGIAGHGHAGFCRLASVGGRRVDRSRDADNDGGEEGGAELVLTFRDMLLLDGLKPPLLSD